jgi:hypothetical protein
MSSSSSRARQRGWLQREITLGWDYAKEVRETWQSLLKVAAVLTPVLALLPRAAPLFPAAVLPWLSGRRLALAGVVLLGVIAQYIVWRKRATRRRLEFHALAVRADLYDPRINPQGSSAVIRLRFGIANSGVDPVVVLGPTVELLQRRWGIWREIPCVTSNALGTMNPRGLPKSLQITQPEQFRFEIARRDLYDGEFQLQLTTLEEERISENRPYRVRVAIEVLGDDQIEATAPLKIYAPRLPSPPPVGPPSPKASE